MAESNQGWRSSQAFLCENARRLSYELATRDRALDKNAASPRAFNQLKAQGHIPQPCELRQAKYLNNLIEQDHRFIKRLTKPGMGFFSFETAWRTLQGFEIVNMLRKGQWQGVDKGDSLGQVALVSSLFGVAAETEQEGSSTSVGSLPDFLQHNKRLRP